jgi:hypothetical protein
MTSPSLHRYFVIVTLLATTSGCAHVKPYERGKLAHHSMTSELEGPATAHTLAVHEGATGGGSLAESGCGCN